MQKLNINKETFLKGCPEITFRYASKDDDEVTFRLTGDLLKLDGKPVTAYQYFPFRCTGFSKSDLGIVEFCIDCFNNELANHKELFDDYYFDGTSIQVISKKYVLTDQDRKWVEDRDKRRKAQGRTSE